ncbi:6-phosphogluconolactonase/glucosamine-6-phosphate isomerase/deaminase [Bradyrhizobium sp. F1.13.4]
MTAAEQPKLIVEADAEALARAAAERVMARIAANSGRIAICLTGGSSPKRLYQLARQRRLARKDPVGARALVHR